MTTDDNNLKSSNKFFSIVSGPAAPKSNSKNHIWLDHCQRIAVEQAELLFDELSTALQEALNSNIDNAATNQRHMQAFENLRDFRNHKQNVKQHFCEKVSTGFEQFKTKELATYIREHEYKDNSWSLVENDDLEETISINTISFETNLEYEGDLWKLNKRLSILNDGAPVDEHNNPLAPIQFCVALRSALKFLSFDIDAKLTTYKTFATLIYKHFEIVLVAANNYLITEGVLPNLNFEQSGSSNPSASTNTTANDSVSERSDLEEISPSEDSEKISTEVTTETELVNAIRNLLKQTRNYRAPQSSGTSPTGGSSGTTIIFTNKQVVEATESIQQNDAESLLSSAISTAADITSTSKRLSKELTAVSPSGQIDPQDMYTIDLVGMLFEYILTDDNLPDSIKTLLSHLHTPFLKLAFIDTQFFEKKGHPSRLLLDSLAEAGANWVNHDGTAQYDMYNEIKSVVQRIMKEFKNDVSLFAEALIEFNILKKKTSHMHKLKERNSVEKMQGQEKLRQAKKIARQTIKQRIQGRRLPSSVVKMLSPWFTYLTFIELRNGENLEQWNQAVKVIDDLLLYCSVRRERIDSLRLSENFNEIIKSVETGLKAIGYNQNKALEIVEGLKTLKQSILDKRALQAKANTKAIEEKIEASEAIKGSTSISETKVITDIGIKPDAANSLPELEQKEPAPVLSMKKPVAEKEDTPTPEEEKVINYLRLIEPGTWIEFKGKLRLKVSGFSSKVSKYMLVDQTSQKVVMRTRLDLARDIISGRAKVVAGSTKPLFERALERIFHNLDEQTKVAK